MNSLEKHGLQTNNSDNNKGQDNCVQHFIIGQNLNDSGIQNKIRYIINLSAKPVFVKIRDI